MVQVRLTAKQAGFCAEYLVDLNAAQAAIRAGYAVSSAKVTGSKLLTNANVQEQISKLKVERSERVRIRADDVLKELGLVAFANLLDYVTPQKDGSVVIDLSELTRDQAAALGEVTVDEYIEGKGDSAREVKRVRFKMLNKLEALEKLGKHLQLFKEEVVHPHQILSDEERDRRIGAILDKARARRDAASEAVEVH